MDNDKQPRYNNFKTPKEYHIHHFHLSIYLTLYSGLHPRLLRGLLRPLARAHGRGHRPPRPAVEGVRPVGLALHDLGPAGAVHGGVDCGMCFHFIALL
jgi:hypothetical protein